MTDIRRTELIDRLTAIRDSPDAHDHPTIWAMAEATIVGEELSQARHETGLEAADRTTEALGHIADRIDALVTVLENRLGER